MKGYKYRSIEKDVFDRDFKTIENNSFYSSNYSILNDPFDIYFDEEISQLVNILKILFPIKELDNFENQFKEVLKFKEKIGVYCLSSDFLNEQLWAYYASSYAGYCIEYDLDKLVDKGQNVDFQCQFEINYKENIPTLDIDDITNLKDNFIQKMFATKKSAWQHEKEIRLIFDKYGMKKFHPSAITGMYFGIKTPDIIKESFYKLFESRDVKFYEVFPSNFKLDFRLINETKRKLKYDVTKFDFEIIRPPLTNQWEQIFDIYYKGNPTDKQEIEKFIEAFKEKYCTKESTLYIFNNKEVLPLLEKYPLTVEQNIQYENSIITTIYNK
ncbi:DUF2971 domain-containing protein [Chryseobacterium shigense]|uniref:DUF2971 domain-containing protein n=1 Tax=Chryseobacterium shigense TaxID=297244 RepID=A0A841NC21_9FLAO|nr:DUF2971 domain-containing protein [Chryseobacterium shigense]MBB6371258.1 hypothetical protein [Chryseobacterium shigense]